jgi:hypothetical protein
MDREEKVLQEYILYVQHKENFVTRSFSANKFYLITALIVLALTVPVKFIPFSFGFVFTMLFSLIGMLLCVLWIMNNSAYKKMLKIKFQNVIERLEDELPVKPYQMESQAIRESNKKRCILFADMQQALSLLILIAFLTIFVNELCLMLTL